MPDYTLNKTGEEIEEFWDCVPITHGGTGEKTATNALNAIGGRFIYPAISIPGGESASVSLSIGYGSYIITGTIGSLGGTILGLTIYGDAVASVKNLMTGQDWNNVALQLSYDSSGMLTMTNGSASLTRVNIFGG